MNYYQPIDQLNEDQKAFLHWYSISVKIPDDAKDLEEFYLYLLNKRRKWFKSKAFFKALPKGMHPKKGDYDAIHSIVADGGGSAELADWVCGAMTNVYKSVDQWRQAYGKTMEDNARLQHELDVVDAARRDNTEHQRNIMLENTLREKLNEFDSAAAAWQMERTILVEERDRQCTELMKERDALKAQEYADNDVRVCMENEIDDLKDRNEQLLKESNDYYDTHLLPLYKKYDELCQEYSDLKQLAYDTDIKLKDATEQLDKQHSIMAALRAVFQLSQNAPL